jgi:hypothetical protein
LTESERIIAEVQAHVEYVPEFMFAPTEWASVARELGVEADNGAARIALETVIDKWTMTPAKGLVRSMAAGKAELGEATEAFRQRWSGWVVDIPGSDLTLDEILEGLEQQLLDQHADLAVTIARPRLVDVLCKYWGEGLSLPVRSSMRDGVATGPMVRFLVAACVLNDDEYPARIGPWLTPDQARGAIRKYERQGNGETAA